MIRTVATAMLCLRVLGAQAAAPAADPVWHALGFLEGTWEAKTRQAASGITATGTYTFRKELGGHVLARHSSAAGCRGPVDADCEHADLLYVYQEAKDQPPRAIYFDNEGHVIHYRVSTPAPGRAVFLSDDGGTGPQFRLMYELKGRIMDGKFQMRMPGKAEWTSYLEWSGARK